MELPDRQITSRQRRLLAMVLVVIGILVLASQCACVSGGTPRPLSPAERDAAAVRVEVACQPDGTAQELLQRGSGVVVDELHVLTAAHVVKCLDGQHVAWVGVRAAHRGLRVAVVERGDWAHDVVRLRLAQPVSGAPRPARAVAVVGRAMCSAVRTPAAARYCGVTLEVRYRRVSDKLVDIHGGWTSLPGNSGGGLYDLQGRLVGLVTNRDACPDGQHEGWCGGLATSLATLDGL